VSRIAVDVKSSHGEFGFRVLWAAFCKEKRMVDAGRVEPNAELINIKRESKTARKLFRISGPSCFQGAELRHESLRRLQKSKPRRGTESHLSECLSTWTAYT